MLLLGWGVDLSYWLFANFLHSTGFLDRGGRLNNQCSNLIPFLEIYFLQVHFIFHVHVS